MFCSFHSFTNVGGFQGLGHLACRKGVQRAMEYDVFAVGNRVCVISSSPFTGLRGTVRTVNTIATDLEDDEPFCFYQIVLEGTHIREPMWFNYDEVELVGPS